METLSVTYYIEEDTKSVKPFVYEKSSIGQEYFKQKQFFEMINSYNMTEQEKEIYKELAYIAHYKNLIKKGHSYEEILKLLNKELQEKENNHSRLSTIVGLLKEKDYLEIGKNIKATYDFLFYAFCISAIEHPNILEELAIIINDIENKSEPKTLEKKK